MINYFQPIGYLAIKKLLFSYYKNKNIKTLFLLFVK